MRLSSLLIAVMILAGCAARPTVSENQCRAGDWQTIGYRDGSTGADSTRLLAHQEACGEFGIIPERGSYQAGWSEGVETYCTGDNGFSLGQGGGSLNTVCRGELRQPFATAYAEGFKLYSARREVRRLAQQLSNHKSRIGKLQQEIVAVTAAQLQADLLFEERLRLATRLASLVEERAVITIELPDIEDALYRAEDELARLDQSYALR
jgi:hypothetical protein